MYRISKIAEQQVLLDQKAKTHQKNIWKITRNEELKNIAIATFGIVLLGSLAGHIFVPNFLNQFPKYFFPPISDLNGLDKKIECVFGIAACIPTILLVFMVRNSFVNIKRGYDNYKSFGKKN